MVILLLEKPKLMCNKLGLSCAKLRVRDDFQKKNGKISDIEQKGGRGVESISLFLIY